MFMISFQGQIEFTELFFITLFISFLFVLCLEVPVPYQVLHSYAVAGKVLRFI